MHMKLEAIGFFFFKLGLGWNMFLYFVLVLFLQRIHFIKTLSLTN